MRIFLTKEQYANFIKTLKRKKSVSIYMIGAWKSKVSKHPRGWDFQNSKPIKLPKTSLSVSFKQSRAIKKLINK